MTENPGRSSDGGPGAALPGTIELPADLGFVAAGDLHARLLGACDRNGVVIDASKVETLSTAAVLVLVSFLNARAARTLPATVQSPSGPFIDAFSDLGLYGTLMRMEFRA